MHKCLNRTAFYYKWTKSCIGLSDSHKCVCFNIINEPKEGIYKPMCIYKIFLAGSVPVHGLS